MFLKSWTIISVETGWVMNSYLAQRGGGRVVIRNLPDRWAESLRRLLAPYVSLIRVEADSGDGLWSLEVCPPSSVRGASTIFGEGYEVAIADQPQHIHVFTEADEMRSVQRVLRVLRALLRRLFMSAEWSFCLHAACVVGDRSEDGVAIVGAKQSGKTSSVLTALRTGQFDYVTNDDLIVTASAQGGYVGHGWPRSISVRKEAAAAFLSPADIDSFAHPENSQNETLGRGGLAYPAELVALFSRRVVINAGIAAFVFPRFGSSNVIEQLTPIETAGMLKAEMPRSPSHADSWLDEPFAALLARSASVDLQRICSSIPGYSMTSRDLAGMEENMVGIRKLIGC
jgi:hypothetical protein